MLLPPCRGLGQLCVFDGRNDDSRWRDCGLPAALAKQLAEATVTGAGALIEAADESPSTLRENVTSGVNVAALAVLMGDDGLPSLMERAVRRQRNDLLNLAPSRDMLFLI